MSPSFVYPVVYQSHSALCPSALSGQNSTDSVVTIVSKSVKLAWGNEWDSCLSKKPDRMNGVSDDNKYISYIHISCSHLSFHMFAVSAFPQHVQFKNQ